MARKYTVFADDLISFAIGLEGKTLKTLHRSAEFTVEIKDDSLVYTPLKTNLPRTHPRKTLEMICTEFSKTNSFRPSHYDGTRNASYTLTLIHLCLKIRGA